MSRRVACYGFSWADRSSSRHGRLTIPRSWDSPLGTCRLILGAVPRKSSAGTALHDLARQCHSELDADGLQRQLLRSLRRRLPVDAAFFATADPETAADRAAERGCERFLSEPRPVRGSCWRLKGRPGPLRSQPHVLWLAHRDDARDDHSRTAPAADDRASCAAGRNHCSVTGGGPTELPQA